ncbi:hypothetical protein SFUMM280S_00472 [Streptomyces fumanus]
MTTAAASAGTTVPTAVTVVAVRSSAGTTGAASAATTVPTAPPSVSAATAVAVRSSAGRPGGLRRDDRTGHRGSDRPFNRDRQGDRPGFRSVGDCPYGRRDDHRGTSSFGRREDKPRWKRNG